MKKLLFSVCAVLAVFGCGGDDGDLPCLKNCDDRGDNNQVVYCGFGGGYACERMTVGDCNYYGGANYGNDSRCGGSSYPTSSSGGGSGYCRYGNSCSYMSVNDCYNYYGGTNYGNDSNCGGGGYPSSNSSGGNTCNANFRTVTIGSQTWMAENLNCNVAGSKCYNNQTSYCDTYGRLYDWATAMALPSSCNSSYCSSQIQSKHRGICPSGWHIPSNDDWDRLMNYVGGYETAGWYLKATSGWNSGGNGTDQFGFSALPGGYSGGSFRDVGYVGYWWSASEHYSNYASGWYMDCLSEDAGWVSIDKSYLFSVRCVQD